MVTEGAEEPVSARNLRPRPSILIAGGVAVAAVSFAVLDWSAALAATVLGLLMIAGAEVDARTFLLPDVVTGGTLLAGILAAAALDPAAAGWSALEAAMRAAGTAATLLLVRSFYARLRNREGLGFGDIKLAAGIGAWLPLGAIPVCFALAAGAALIAVLLAHLRGQRIEAATRIPFGAFLCPALWLVFVAEMWPS
jgi:leader peptidase (prepilin peptidase) / N-methyltransferase